MQYDNEPWRVGIYAANIVSPIRKARYIYPTTLITLFINEKDTIVFQPLRKDTYEALYKFVYNAVSDCVSKNSKVFVSHLSKLPFTA